jgi:hypothetical protein
MAKKERHFREQIIGRTSPGWGRFALVWALVLLVCLALTPPQPVPAATPAPSSSPPAGKVLEELRYRVDVWIWRDAINAKMVFKEVAPGRYLAELKGHTQGFLSFITGNWGGVMSTEMQYSQGKLQPLVYREISNKGGNHKVMEYRFDYAQNKVELWKKDKDKPMTKKWETKLKGPMYDPLTFFYNGRLTGNPLGSKGGETLKFQGIPYPEPDEIVLRVGTKTPQGRKIMVELGNRVFKGERSQVYAFLDSDGVLTKAWTQVLKFGEITIELLPGSKRLNKQEVTKVQDRDRARAASH